MTTSRAAVLSVIPALDLMMVPTINMFGDMGGTFRIQYIHAVGPTSNWLPLATVTLTNSPQLYLTPRQWGNPSASTA